MALRIHEITLRFDEDEQLLAQQIADRLQLRDTDIQDLKIVRKGLDARRKSRILKVYTVDFCCPRETLILEKFGAVEKLVPVPVEPLPECLSVKKKLRVLIVGTGPAGLFSALTLAEAGADVTLIERGRPLDQRIRDVECFWNGGILNPESNIQFGEGGAGTFSDGKLTCRLNHPATRMILERFVGFGAPEDILYLAKPHIGSDRLRRVVLNIRKHLLNLSVDLRFASRLTGLEVSHGQLQGGIINGENIIPCDRLILATGHSARDTYQMLRDYRIHQEPKAFALGLRVEHPLELINRIQYGRKSHPDLPAADYRLTWNDSQTRRGVYSFCMCPGGQIVNASSEPGGIVVNGMSLFKRDHPCSNSALVVTVSPEDFSADDELAGIRYQRVWEHAAFTAGRPGWNAPAQPLLEFLGGKGGRLNCTCRPKVVHADLNRCLPDFVSASLRRALPIFDRKMPGFCGPEAVLVGVETRTSSAVRILRDDTGQSPSLKGLYPAGEGAGYAGGIMSAALDGRQTAEQIIRQTGI